MNIERFNLENNPTEEQSEILLARMQFEAAMKAATIGSFRSDFRARVQHAISDGLVTSKIADDRLSAIDAVTSGHEMVGLDTTPDGVLGWNRIGAGDSGMRLSRATFAAARVGDGSAVDQTIAHESAHGRQVQLQGELTVNGKTVDHLELYEGHAELHGNEAVGQGISHHREGQPEEVYGVGQRIVATIIQRASRAALERALTKDGDLTQLQKEIDGNVADQPVTQLSV